ncbi:O-methyltransferase [Streptacidiphilus monticola]|uniref:O-methyltransferase n=1 Tax=Streptacidiphilus monticola TaxID=2161674 RepID=A0ABW1FUM3_9ACTN
MTTEETWQTVDSYLTDTLGLSDPALEAGLKAADAAGLPRIAVSAEAGKLLNLLVQITGARRVLEIGTLGGYSTTWLARGLPGDGKVITLEYSEKHAGVARANLDAAGVGDKVEIRVGAALDTLPQLELEQLEPFDLVFIDADKENNPNYLRWALRLSRPGTVIVVDNVVRNGAVADAASDRPDVLGTRAALEYIAEEPRLDGTALQTVGSKGYDGFALARVVS